QTASTRRISWAKTLNKINLTCKFNRWCNGAIDKVTTLHVNGPGFNSRRGKFFLLFFVVLFLFSLFCFHHILPIGRFQFSHIASPHHSFMRRCAKPISSIKVARGDA
ncbi:MAG: hypothetical protein MI923_00355, partial [Phycisphaerales bacterium]|nr:hypothetical protein [Phycisphaerales bacterium]